MTDNPAGTAYRHSMRLFILCSGLWFLTACALSIRPPDGHQEQRAALTHDEGGPRVLSGLLHYTNAFFTTGVAAPMVILEDQAGFVDRNSGFIFPPESQTLGQITSDFYTPPVSYTLALPIEPQGSLRDVDNDTSDDSGVMIFAVAYWTNKFGDPFLEARDLFGGGWSTAYASTRVSNDAANRNEIVGGKLLVFAPDDEQGFPSDFGPDGLLFTGDEPVVGLSPGDTLVDLDERPFAFDRSARPHVDLIEPDAAALVDFSALTYTTAFDAMVEKMRREYAFTEYKGIDWDVLADNFRSRFVLADRTDDRTAYLYALRDFCLAIPDGHLRCPPLLGEWQRATAGGLGMRLSELDDGRFLVYDVMENGPAHQAGIDRRTEILAIDGQPVDSRLDEVFPWNGPFSTEHVRRLQALRTLLRSPVGTDVSVTFRNQDAEAVQTTILRSVAEQMSWAPTWSAESASGFELPLEYELLDSGYVYVKIHSFFDNDLLTIQLWERLVQTLNQERIPGLIIDLRQNSGGSGFLADQMAAYFFDESLELGNTGRYDPKSGEFFFDPRTIERFHLPSPDLRYEGDLAVLVGPNCSSACEFFAYDLTLQDRATIVGHYPTAGLGGSVDQFLMPENQFIQFTVGRAVDMNGEIHLEGKGVSPTVRVPVNEETVFAPTDAVLTAAITHLNQAGP